MAFREQPVIMHGVKGFADDRQFSGRVPRFDADRCLFRGEATTSAAIDEFTAKRRFFANLRCAFEPGVV